MEMWPEQQEFYTIIDDVWARFWASNHMEQPKVKSHFVSYIEDRVGIDDDSGQSEFKSAISYCYLVDNDYVSFKEFVIKMIVRFIEAMGREYQA